MGRSPAEIAEDSLERGRAAASELFPATTLVFRKGFSPNPPPKKDWIRALTLYSPIANSKTPPHLCARLSGWKWGEQVEKAVAFSDDHKLQARSSICGKSHIFMRQVRGGVKACGERGGGVRGTGRGRARPGRHSGLPRAGGRLGPPRWCHGSRGRGGPGRRCGPGSPCPPGSGCRRR